jgi:hypothetical protein
VLVLIPLYIVVMSLVDGTKNTYYLVHVTPLFVLSLTIFASQAVRLQPRLTGLVATGLAGVALLQAGGILYKSHRNSYRNRWEPMARFLVDDMVPRSIVAGSAALAFDLGFDGRNLIDDARLGYVSGVKPDFIVMDEIYAEVFKGHTIHRPAVAKYVQQLLPAEYRQVYNFGDIVIYQRIGADVAAKRTLNRL